DEHLSVAHATTARGRGQRSHNFVGASVGHNQLHFHLRKQIDLVLLAAIDLRVSLLAAVPAYFRYGHAVNTDAQQRVLHFIQLVGLDNRFDFLHSLALPFPRVTIMMPLGAIRAKRNLWIGWIKNIYWTFQRSALRLIT